MFVGLLYRKYLNLYKVTTTKPSARSMGVGLCTLFQVVVVCRLDLYTASLLISPKYAVSKSHMYLFQLPLPIPTRSVGLCLLVRSPRTCKTVSQPFVFKLGL